MNGTSFMVDRDSLRELWLTGRQLRDLSAETCNDAVSARKHSDEVIRRAIALRQKSRCLREAARAATAAASSSRFSLGPGHEKKWDLLISADLRFSAALDRRG